MASVTVLGRGIVRTQPDEAMLTLTVEATKPTPAEALDDVAERGRELTALCDELGIAAEQRVTAGATVAERVEHDREGRPQHRGYLATNRLIVRVGDGALAGRLLGAAVARVAARVDGPWWSIALDNPARLEACQTAAQDARARAAAYADALGARLGAIVAVRDPETRHPGPEPRGGMRLMSAAEGIAPPVEGGEQAIVAAVEIEFALEQG
jgi:uncharacterized protein YggE